MKGLRLYLLILGIIVNFFFLILFPFKILANNNADPVNSSVSVSPGTIPADGATNSTISVNVKDSLKNNLAGDRITLTNASNDPGLVINGGSVGATDYTAATDSNGNVTFTVSSSDISPGTDTLTVTDVSSSPSVVLGSVRITFTPSALAPNATCKDATPGSNPQLISAFSNGPNKITLTWTSATGPLTHYLVAYGIASKQYIYGNPNVGNTTSYAVGSLTEGKTYYFVVSAVNGCRPGNFSNEISTIAERLTTPTSTQIKNLNVSSSRSVTISPSPKNTPTSTPITSLAFEPTDTPAPVAQELFANIKALGKTAIYIFILAGIASFGFVLWQRFRK